MSHAEKPVDTRAPDTIENEIEATRQRLAGTIDQLLHRSSPKTIANHLSAARQKLAVDNDFQLTRQLLDCGWPGA